MAGNSNEPKIPGFLGTLKWLVYLFVLTLLLDLCVAFFAGTAHLQRVLEQDLIYIDRLDANNAVYNRSVGTANTLYRWLFVGSGIESVGAHYNTHEQYDPDAKDGRSKERKAQQIDDHILAKAYIMSWPMIQTAMLGLQIYGVRLGIVISMLPLGIVVVFAALLDGWVVRQVRKYRAARESSDRHNLAMSGLFLSLLIIGLYLMVPVSVDPRFVLFPALIIGAFLIWCAVAFFKKYL